MLSEPIKDLSELVQERPKEHYRFRVDPGKMGIVEKTMVSYVVKRAMFTLIPCLAMAILGLCLDRSLFAFFMGIFLVLLGYHVKNVRWYRNNFVQNKLIWAQTIYDYSLYEDELLIWDSSETTIHQMRIPLKAIKRIRKIGNFIVLEIGVHLYMLDKSVLREDSYFIRMC